VNVGTHGRGLAGRYVRSKPAIEGAIATHLQERFVANCSEFNRLRLRSPDAAQHEVMRCRAGVHFFRS
jgi:hypothetical protein